MSSDPFRHSTGSDPAAEQRLRELARQGEAKSAAGRELLSESRPEVVLQAFYNAGWQTPLVVAIVAWGVGGIVGAVLLLALLGHPVLQVLGAVMWTVTVVLLHTRAWRAVARRSLAREQAFIGALGFAMEGYFERLGTHPRARSTVVTVELQGRGPERRVLEGIAALAMARLEEQTDHRIVIEGPEIDDPHNEHDQVLDNSGLLQWQRRLVAQVLIPLHQAHPIARVTLA